MLDSFKARMERLGKTQGNAYLQNADMVIDATFKRDPSYREVFLTHALNKIELQKMDAKFMIHTHRSITGDSEDYYLQFRPHVKVPIGSYVDIPNDEGKYERWLIVEKDNRPQFPLYYVLKCNWTLKWYVNEKVYKCLGVLRNQNSYNSGLWQDYIFESVENQNKFWMPTAPFSQTLNYGQFVLMNDEGREIPIRWKVSKIEDLQPKGVTKATFTQEQTSLSVDCGKFGIAEWCKCEDHTTTKNEVCKYCRLEEPHYIDAGLEMPQVEYPCGRITYNGKDSTLRVGGSSKVFVAEFWDEFNLVYTADKPIWKLSFMDDNVLLCSINLHYHNDDWEIEPSDDCPENIVISDLSFKDDISTPSDVDACDITCSSNGKEIFKINVAPAEDDWNALKLRCLQLYSMVGKKIVVSAANKDGKYAIEKVMEVIS